MKLYLCGANGLIEQTVDCSPSSVVETASDRMAVDQLVACTPASITIAGASGDGDVDYTAFFGGLHGNTLTVAHETGDTGVGHEDRVLDLLLTGLDLVITFGTNGSGDSVTPTAQAIEELVAADSDLAQSIVAVAQDTGLGDAAAQTPTALVGGLDNGTRYRITKQHVCPIARIEA